VISLLSTIVHMFVCWVETAVVTVINLVVLALGALASALVSADPIDFPTFPGLGSTFGTAAGWVAWFFPVHTAVLIVAFMFTAWLAWQVIALALRWAKAI
jgi:hypothetical protein